MHSHSSKTTKACASFHSLSVKSQFCKKIIIIKYVSLKELLILKLENGVSEEYLNICLTIMMETCRLFSSMVSSNQDLRDYSLMVLWGRWS